jgi:hypothetical protein
MLGPAARAFTEAQLGGPCNDFESSPVIPTTVGVLAIGNGDRVGLVIMNLSANTLYIGLSPTVSTTNGILLSPNGGVFGVSVRDDFTLPSRQWYGISVGGSAQCYVLEVVRQTGGTT